VGVSVGIDFGVGILDGCDVGCLDGLDEGCIDGCILG
jgi:hypothetical protein